MTQEERKIRRTPDETRPANAASGDGDSGEKLLPHVRGWGGVAREARERCEKGSEAVRKLRLRRNRSGE